MAKKRTKADKLQRQADQLEKRLDNLLVKTEKKKPREDMNQIAARVVREATEGR